MLNFQDTHPAPKSDTYWPPRRVIAACGSDSCKQGRAECKTPDACRIADDEPEFFTPGEDLFSIVLMVGAVAFLIWIVVLLGSKAQGA